METKVQILFLIAFVATVWYLVEFFAFAGNVKKNENSFWTTAGMPERFGIAGQLTYFRIVWGLYATPPGIRQRYGRQFWRLRALFVLAVVCYIALLALTF